MRYIITMIWSCIFCEIIGFIAASLTQMQFNPMQSLLLAQSLACYSQLLFPPLLLKATKIKVSITNYNLTKFEYYKKLFLK